MELPFRKIRPLGEGAGGEVWMCVDVTSRRLLVVKWLRLEAEDAGDSAARFHREASALGADRPRGVVEVEQQGEDDRGHVFMVMRFVDGLPPTQVISPGDAVGVHRLLAGLGTTLDELHGLGVVHRDVKPDNVVLGEGARGWEPFLIDFGIAKWLGHSAGTATGSVFGTPPYMSPEQIRDTKRVGPATDRYALAVMAYELLGGRLPFSGKSLPEVMEQHLHAEVPPLRLPDLQRPVSSRTVLDAGEGKVAVRPTPHLDAFFARALAKRPEQRFDAASELARGFAAAARADGLAGEPRPSSPLFPPFERPIVEVSVAGVVAGSFDVRHGPITLGRHDDCQVQVGHPRLSRYHACVYSHRGRMWIADLGSHNGTALRGRPLEHGKPVPLSTDGRPQLVALHEQEIELRTLPP